MSRTLASVSQSSISLAPVWKCHSCIVLVSLWSHWSWNFQKVFLIFMWVSGTWLSWFSSSPAPVTRWYSLSPPLASHLASLMIFLNQLRQCRPLSDRVIIAGIQTVTSLPCGGARPDDPTPLWDLWPQGLAWAAPQLTLGVLALCLLLIVPVDQKENQHVCG